MIKPGNYIAANPFERIGAGQCPNVFLYQLHHPTTGAKSDKVVEVRCQRKDGHRTDCLVQNPNDGYTYSVQAEHVSHFIVGNDIRKVK